MLVCIQTPCAWLAQTSKCKNSFHPCSRTLGSALSNQNDKTTPRIGKYNCSRRTRYQCLANKVVPQCLLIIVAHERRLCVRSKRWGFIGPYRALKIL